MSTEALSPQQAIVVNLMYGAELRQQYTCVLGEKADLIETTEGKFSKRTGYAVRPFDAWRRLYLPGTQAYDERVARSLGTYPGHYWYIHEEVGHCNAIRTWSGEVLRRFDEHLATIPDEEAIDDNPA